MLRKLTWQHGAVSGRRAGLEGAGLSPKRAVGPGHSCHKLCRSAELSLCPLLGPWPLTPRRAAAQPLSMSTDKRGAEQDSPGRCPRGRPGRSARSHFPKIQPVFKMKPALWALTRCVILSSSKTSERAIKFPDSVTDKTSDGWAVSTPLHLARRNLEEK